jgi:hypothetical protein
MRKGDPGGGLGFVIEVVAEFALPAPPKREPEEQVSHGFSEVLKSEFF